MQCDDIRDQLSAALDGELHAPERDELEQHLAACAACRDAMTALQSLDDQLRRTTAALRDRAPDIANAALSRLPPRAATATLSPQSPASLRRSALLATTAMACGFLLAALLFRPAQDVNTPSTPADSHVAVDVPPTPAPAAPAFIRVATGPMEVATTPAAWTTLANPDGFVCQAGVAVRTTAAAVCELETSGGATVRMNSATELAFVDNDDIQLAQGEIWCRTPDAARLKVTPAIKDAPAAPPLSLLCGPEGPAACVFTCPTPTVSAKVRVAIGRVEIVSSNHSEQIAAGRSVEFRDGAMRPVASAGVLSGRWMHPLLVLKGPSDDELAARVNALLAEVGRTKLSYLCERDLRSLGEYGALPLLRFLQLPPIADDVRRRQTAAAILADVAPAWMTPELIELLADADPTVRVSAATGLQRLTGDTLGMAPESWNEADHDFTPAINQWRAWWQSERPAYPSPPAGVTL